ncbi:MAG: DUF2249 domain-containing protein [Nitrosomonadales bacterium]|nr:DUF2249 domain-containing protein [Nitrosomonadales bacterium]
MSDRLVDARWLEPPEPMELTLAALETLEPGGRVRLLIHREPYLLFPILEEWGYAYQIHSGDDGTYEILIRHKEQAAP